MWLELDHELVVALRAWRRAARRLERAADAPESCPISETLVHDERIAEAAESEEPVTRACVPWLRALSLERRAWPDRVALARQWHRRVPVAMRGGALSLRELRAEALRSPIERERAALAAALAEAAAPLSDAAVAALERRLELDGTANSVESVAAAQVTELATLCLERTRDLAAPWQRRGWVEGLRAALGSEAREGWPARLGLRWIDEVFGGSRLTAGLRVALGALPEAWGASSFCLALGMFGVALLDAARPPSLPLAWHQHPRGTRRHERFALFGALPIEPSFAMRTLGLGRGRALDHSRAVAAALLCSLRVDALRVRLAAAPGKRAFQETFVEITEAAFGEPLPLTLAGALPQLRAADAPAFAGTLLAVQARAALVAAYDEDWFRNPRAAHAIRQADRDARGEPPNGEELTRALAAVVQRFEALLG